MSEISSTPTNSSAPWRVLSEDGLGPLQQGLMVNSHLSLWKNSQVMKFLQNL